MKANEGTLTVASCPNCGGGSGIAVMEREAFTLIQCNQCGLIYSSVLEIPNTLYEDAYADDGEYQYYLSAASQPSQQIAHIPWPMRRFLRQGDGAGRTLLDIGCSTGNFLLAAQKHHWRVTGVEVSKKAAMIARHRTGADVYIGSATAVASNETFDVVTSWEVLEHLPDPKELSATILNLLKPGGVWVLSVPNWQSPWMQTSKAPEHWPPFHLTFWTMATLSAFLRTAGFVDIQVAAKPFAWGEELGNMKWLALPVSLIQSYFFNQKGIHIFAVGRKP